MKNPKHFIYVPKTALFSMTVFFAIVISTGFFLVSCSNEDSGIMQDDSQLKTDQDAAKLSGVDSELFRLRQKAIKFKNFTVSQAQGYDAQVTEYVSQMGIHYLNASLLDNTFDLEHPEILVYVPDENGNMQFVAVEYAVPILDMNAPPPPPEGFTGSNDVWVINTTFHLWTLHVWVGMENPNGIFASHNPNVP